MSNQKVSGKFWDKKALALHLGVPVTWIDKRTRKNGPEIIPHIKLGKYVRFNPESPTFREWLASHGVGVQSPGLVEQALTQEFDNRPPVQ